MKGLATHLGIFFLGLCIQWLLSFPVRIVKLLFLGEEISAQASFPTRHMARVYSLPGSGDQHLALEIDGNRVWESPDLEPGNIHGRAVWAADSRSVSLLSNDERLYTYDLTSQTGKAFIGKNAE
jgi:hypothetical protein